MANQTVSLDTAFQALSDPTRRAVINRLTEGEAPVGELAKPFEIGLPAFLKHLSVLERSGLIETRKSGRTRVCRIQPKRLSETEAWLHEQRSLWEASTDRLAAYAQTLAQEDKDDLGR